MYPPDRSTATASPRIEAPSARSPAAARFAVRFASPAVGVAEHRCVRPTDELSTPSMMPTTALGFVRCGVGVIRLGRREVQADPNQVVLFCGGDEYRVRHVGCRARVCASVVSLGPDLVAAAFRDVAGRARKKVLRERLVVPRSPRMQEAFARLLGEVRNGGDRLAAEELALQLVCGALQAATGAPRRAVPGGNARIVVRVKEVLAARFHEVPTLEELAREACCSKFHLCRVFKAAVGMPVYRYLHRLRLAEAADRMLEGADDLAGLALDLGFSSHSHFTGVFRREMGVTPSRFRASLGARAGIRGATCAGRPSRRRRGSGRSELC